MMSSKLSSSSCPPSWVEKPSTQASCVGSTDHSGTLTLWSISSSRTSISTMWFFRSGLAVSSTDNMVFAPWLPELLPLKFHLHNLRWRGLVDLCAGSEGIIHARLWPSLGPAGSFPSWTRRSPKVVQPVLCPLVLAPFLSADVAASGEALKHESIKSTVCMWCNWIWPAFIFCSAEKYWKGNVKFLHH